MKRLVTWLALVVIAGMITLPFIPGITDRQTNMVLGVVAIVSVVGAATGAVWQARTERAEDREDGDQR